LIPIHHLTYWLTYVLRFGYLGGSKLFQAGPPCPHYNDYQLALEDDTPHLVLDYYHFFYNERGIVEFSDSHPATPKLTYNLDTLKCTLETFYTPFLDKYTIGEVTILNHLDP